MSNIRVREITSTRTPRRGSAGHYTESLEFRRKQDVKRKAFN
jgi:hypothetical protein